MAFYYRCTAFIYSLNGIVTAFLNCDLCNDNFQCHSTLKWYLWSTVALQLDPPACYIKCRSESQLYCFENCSWWTCWVYFRFGIIMPFSSNVAFRTVPAYCFLERLIWKEEKSILIATRKDQLTYRVTGLQCYPFFILEKFSTFYFLLTIPVYIALSDYFFHNKSTQIIDYYIFAVEKPWVFIVPSYQSTWYSSRLWYIRVQ